MGPVNRTRLADELVADALGARAVKYWRDPCQATSTLVVQIDISDEVIQNERSVFRVISNAMRRSLLAYTGQDRHDRGRREEYVRR